MELKQDMLDMIYDKFCSFDSDPYLLENHKTLFNLFYMVNRKTNWDNYKGSVPLTEPFPKLKTLYLESEFLSSLHPKYRRKFIADCIRRRFSQIGDFSSTEGSYYQNIFDYYRIDYPKNFNIGDFVVLIHEYIHHLSSQFPKIKEVTFSYNVYKEGLSILGELKCLDFLKERGIPQSEIEIYKEYLREGRQSNLRSFLFTEPLFEIYLSKEKLTEDKIGELLNSNSFYHSMGEKLVYFNLNTLSSLTDSKFADNLSYVHPLGMMIAASLHQDGISNEGFVELIDKINILEIHEFERLLPQKSGTELVNDTVKEFNFQKRK